MVQQQVAPLPSYESSDVSKVLVAKALLALEPNQCAQEVLSNCSHSVA